IFARLDDDRPLATAPGDDRGPIFVITAPTRLAFLAATTRAATQGLLPTLLGLPLVARGVIEVIRFHRALQLALHLSRTEQHCAWSRLWNGARDAHLFSTLFLRYKS